MSNLAKNVAFWAIFIIIVLYLVKFISEPKTKAEGLSFSQFMEQVDNGKVESVSFKGENVQGQIEGKLRTGIEFQTYGLIDWEVFEKLKAKGVGVTYKESRDSPIWQVLASWLPLLLLVGIWFFFMRQMQSGGGKAMSFGKSRAKLMNEKSSRITFKDVAGIDEAKAELEEIIEFLKDPKKFTKLGGHIPKGVLLIGAPGTGKTLLARAIAGEAEVPFFNISGSDFVEMFVGVGASRVRDLFIQGKKNAPCIIFIDEIDAVGRWRGAGLGGGHDEREQTLNQLLVEMDGFESNDGVILIAATNRPDVLDHALLRPGRFDRQVIVPRPDIRGREAILKVHTEKKPLGEDVSLEVIARGTPGFSGADLENLVNEAALLAARFDKEKIEMLDFENAKDKVLMGTERKSLIISDEEKRSTAIHEAGHALIAYLIPGTDPVHKVSIIPRGMALGSTQRLPKEDKHNVSKTHAMNDIAVLMGGRVAEELVFGDKTTGAGNDIEQATELARKMVREWGMSDKLGPLSFGKKEEQIFLGRDITQRQDYSEATAQEIDAEVKNIVVGNYDRTTRMLKKNIDNLNLIADALLEREVLSGKELKILLEGGKLEELPKPPPKEAEAPDKAEAEEKEKEKTDSTTQPISTPKIKPHPA